MHEAQLIVERMHYSKLEAHNVPNTSLLGSSSFLLIWRKSYQLFRYSHKVQRQRGMLFKLRLCLYEEHMQLCYWPLRHDVHK